MCWKPPSSFCTELACTRHLLILPCPAVTLLKVSKYDAHELAKKLGLFWFCTIPAEPFKLTMCRLGFSVIRQHTAKKIVQTRKVYSSGKTTAIFFLEKKTRAKKNKKKQGTPQFGVSDTFNQKKVVMLRSNHLASSKILCCAEFNFRTQIILVAQQSSLDR